MAGAWRTGAAGAAGGWDLHVHAAQHLSRRTSGGIEAQISNLKIEIPSQEAGGKDLVHRCVLVDGIFTSMLRKPEKRRTGQLIGYAGARFA